MVLTTQVAKLTFKPKGELMKYAIATFVVLFCAVCHCETAAEMENLAKTVCHATWAKDSQERAKMQAALEKIRPGIPSGYKVLYIAVDDPTAITASTHVNALGQRQSVTCMPIGYIDFESKEGEIEFTLAHETGHAVDEPCYGHNHQSQQLTCERRADDIAFAILQKAGIDPKVAVSLFKKKHEPDRIKNFEAWKKFHPHPQPA